MLIKSKSKLDMKDLKKLPKWKKVKGGVHRHFDGQIVKKDEFLYAEESEIPKTFKDMFVLVRQGKSTGNISTNTVQSLKIVPSIEKNKYDVVNNEGTCLNTIPLTRKEANNFLATKEDEE